MNIQHLDELTTSQLEAALEVGEGATDVEILEVGACLPIKSIWLMNDEGGVIRYHSQVRYQVTIKDDMAEDGEVLAGIFVEVTHLGLIAKY